MGTVGTMEFDPMPGRGLGGLGLQKDWPYGSPSLSPLFRWPQLAIHAGDLERASRNSLSMDSYPAKKGASKAAPPSYSVTKGSSEALTSLLNICESEVPKSFRRLGDVAFTYTSPEGDQVHFPTPLKEQNAIAAIKALEACAAAALVDLQYGIGGGHRRIEVDIDKTSCFLMSAYLTTINGMDKAHPSVKSKVPDTDLNEAQSVLYRRLSANLYNTKNPGEFYHMHGSLEASTTLKMIGLPSHNDKLTDYRACINTIEKAVTKFTTKQLEEINAQHAQAGAPVLTWNEFLATPHGKALSSLPPFTVKPVEIATPAIPFSPTGFGTPYALRGIKVIEMCRIIAGPTIGRSLAAHGAAVLKVTSQNLPDVPFFQVDVNTGKHTTSLDLRNAADRKTFDDLLRDADVLIDGYRPGCLDRLGYGAESLARLAKARGRGFVYVAEDCFGGTGVSGAEWAGRPGWQQIADCVTGVAWSQGEFMGLKEPVVPPFPMSDYGTGALGCVAAMSGLYRRATQGGSWVCRTSLCQYDVFLMRLGLLDKDEQARLRKEHRSAFFALKHNDSVDEVGKRALESVKIVAPTLFTEKMMHTAWSTKFDAVLRWPREAIKVQGVRVGHVRAARPNGADKPCWEGWEEDAIIDG